MLLGTVPLVERGNCRRHAYAVTRAGVGLTEGRDLEPPEIESSLVRGDPIRLSYAP